MDGQGFFVHTQGKLLVAPKKRRRKALLDYDTAEKRCAASGLRDARLYTFVANVLLSMALQEKQETEKTGVHQVKC
jgi:hypothetical protein